ncbi:MAG TPA: hypothetical protein VJU84_13210 [Pyrinomonadaceae bacterium]|nr:hypothetical protein [Pyrinomonadaceae bacterium]
MKSKKLNAINELHETTRKSLAIIVLILAAFVLTSCTKQTANSNETAATRSASETASGETGVEKVKPAPGTGNVQGKVFFNSQPAANITVKLCETFSRFVSGCGGQTFTAQTDSNGEYVITNVSPKTYEALTAQVFDTDSYIFATTGIGISSAKYDVVADKTFFVTPINLFKSDLKTTNPKAGSKVNADSLGMKWDAYPDATYYKFSIFADDASVTSPYINQRVEATSFVLDKPLQKGTYRWEVSAFNKDDKKLAESADDVKFTVQ